MDNQTPDNTTSGNSPGQSAVPSEVRGGENSFAQWGLLLAGLIIFTFLLVELRGRVGPATMALAAFMVLFPLRRFRMLRPLLVLIGLIAAAAVWWRLSALLTPFIIAFVVAFAIDPGVEWLVRRGLPRLVVILIILGLILGGMVGLAILIVPKLITEITDLASNVPRWYRDAMTWGEVSLLPWLSKFNLPLDDLWLEMQAKIPELVDRFVSGFAEWGIKALSGVISLLSGLVNVVLIPVLTIYFLNEYNQIRRKVYRLIPKSHQPIALELYHSLDRVLSGYLRGQLLVSLFLATWIGLGLWLFAGIPYALLLGITAGLLNIVPYIGTTVALVLTLIISLLQPEPIFTALKSLVVFVSAQTLEGNLITPRLIGERVGLHPMVVIFAVLLFASLIGFAGMLIAIPITAAANVGLTIWRKRGKSSDVSMK